MADIVKIQEDARSMARAAQYMGKAANELAPVMIPAAKSAISAVPGVAASTLGRIRAITPEDIKRKQNIIVGVGAAAGAAFAVATIAHVVHHRRVGKVYKEQKRRMADAVCREEQIDEMLEGASEFFDAASFLDSYNDAAADEAGVFAILAYDPKPADGDYGAFRDVYVGASASMKEAALKQLQGKGNLYVHADMVYKRPVYVFFFPCESHEVYARKEALVDLLGAEESYNKVSDLAELD